LWLDYYQDGSLKDSLNYKDGHFSGISLSWYKNGMIRDSSSIDESGKGLYFSWFDNGNPSSAGKYVEFDKRQGKWQYFHKNGQLSSLETYDQDNLVDKKYFAKTDILFQILSPLIARLNLKVALKPGQNTCPKIYIFLRGMNSKMDTRQ